MEIRQRQLDWQQSTLIAIPVLNKIYGGTNKKKQLIKAIVRGIAYVACIVYNI